MTDIEETIQEMEEALVKLRCEVIEECIGILEKQEECRCAQALAKLGDKPLR